MTIVTVHEGQGKRFKDQCFFLNLTVDTINRFGKMKTVCNSISDKVVLAAGPAHLPDGYF